MAFVEVKTGTYSEADQFVFDNAGDGLEGRLIECVNITSRDGNKFKKYVVKTASGNKSFLGCYQLDKALPEFVGQMVRVIYNGKDRIAGGRTVKNFQVFVDEAASN